MDQAIKKGVLEDWVMNWIIPIHKGRDKILVIQLSWLAQLRPSYIALSWNKRLAYRLNIFTNNYLVKHALDQNIPLLIIWLH